jgi:hypothetical protein
MIRKKANENQAAEKPGTRSKRSSSKTMKNSGKDLKTRVSNMTRAGYTCRKGFT